jgi:hypothetical protein
MRLLFASIFFITGALRADNSSEGLGSWTAFGKVGIESLGTGKVVSQCNTSMEFARGLSAQAAYLVAAPLDVTTRVLLNSDPTKHAELDIYQHCRFQNERDAAFETLKLDPQNKSVRQLLASMRQNRDLQLSRAEVLKLPKSAARGEAQQFWTGVLRERWNGAALAGDLGTAEQCDTRSEIQSLLNEEAGITQHFAALLSPLTGPAAPLAPTSYFWEIANVNNMATCELGAVYTRMDEKRRQVLEVTFYASSGYLTAVTLYELIPLTRGGKSSTLVWQGCLVSAPGLAGGFGLKRKIASMLTLNDLERSIRLFQQDAAKAIAGDTR